MGSACSTPIRCPPFHPASDAAAFDAAMTSAVRAGRLLAFLIATGCVLIFAALARRIVRDWRVALIATFAFAFSGGIAVHSRILRSELVAALSGDLCADDPDRGRPPRQRRAPARAWRSRPALCVLGLENKVQAILLIGALPLLVLPFGSATAQASRSGATRAQAGWPPPSRPSRRSLRHGRHGRCSPPASTAALLDAAHFHPLVLGRFGIYQVALLLLIGGCMIAYAAIWRVSAAETLASMLAIAAGASIALLALDLDYNAGNVIAVFNPLEKMLTFADATTTDAASGSSLPANSAGCCSMGSDRCWRATASCCTPRRARPCFSTWLIVPGIVYAWRRGERQAATPGARAAAGSDRDRRARRAARVEIRIFHLHRSPDHPRRRDPARLP